MTPHSADITVRRATLDDTSVVVEFNQRLAEETESKKLNSAVLREGVRAVLDDPELGFYLVATVEDEVVGQLMVTYEWSDWRNGLIWWLQSVFVKEGCRRQGVFRCLYKRLEEMARADSRVVGMRLYVEKNNGRAVETYQRLGLIDAGYQVMERIEGMR